MQNPQTLNPSGAGSAPLAAGRARGGLARYLLVVLLPLVLGPLITVAFLLYRQARADLSSQVFDQLSVLSKVKENQIDQWAAQRAADMDNLARAPDIILAARTLIFDPDASRMATADHTLRQRFDDYLNNTSNADYTALLLIQADTGEVIVSSTSGRNMLGQVLLAEPAFRSARAAGALLAPPGYNAVFNPTAVTVMALAPMVDPQHGASAVILGLVRNDRLVDIMALRPGLRTTTSLHASLITRDGYAVGSAIAPDSVRPDSEGIRRAQTTRLDGSAEYLDPQGETVVGVYNWLERYELTLLVEQDAEEAFAPLGRAATIFAVIIALAVALSTVGVIYFTRSLTQPIAALTEGALRMAGGDLTGRVSVERQDEIGLLAQAFNSMSTQLRELYQSLESKVEARTRQLAAAAEVGRAITSILSTEELLARTVELIRERFGYYHVSIFLLDDLRAYAELRESTGEVGARLKARSYRLAVGSNSIIGWVTANKQSRIALDVGADPVYFQNELLPETRSEAAVPLRIGERIIGALDVQSREPEAFTPADVDVLQILADQIAVAVENGRLFTRQQRIVELEQIVSSVTTKIYKSLTLDSILENAAVELGRALGARRAVVRLTASPEPPEATAGADGNGGHPGQGGS